MMRRNRLFALPLLLLALELFACAPAVDEATPTLPQPAPVTPTGTPTVVWFPATNTPEPVSIEPSEPTLVPIPGAGNVIFSDDFSDASKWQTATSSQAAAIVDLNQLTLVVRAPRVTVTSLRSEPVLGDFYAEATARTNLCAGQDEYGMVFRALSGGDFYRFGLACDGTVRLDIVMGGQRAPLMEPVPSAEVPPGAPGETQIGVWTSGSELRFYLNGRYQFTVIDRTFRNGQIGFYARSSGDSTMSVNFSELVVREVSYASPTPTLTPSTTPKPTRTPRPTP